MREAYVGTDRATPRIVCERARHTIERNEGRTQMWWPRFHPQRTAQALECTRPLLGPIAAPNGLTRPVAKRQDRR